MKRLNVFTNLSHYEHTNRAYLHDILRPYLNERSEDERRRMYGERVGFFNLCEDISLADFCLLPMSWAYYLKTGNTKQAYDFVEWAEKAGKPTVVASFGDHYLDIPFSGRKVIIFQFSLYRSLRKSHEFSAPPDFHDNVALYRNGQPNYRPKQKVATVGFCGNATDNPIPTLYHAGRNLTAAIKHRVKLSPFSQRPIIPAAYLRAKALKTIARSNRVKSNFILREQYWAGVNINSQRNDPANQVRVEYMENLDQSDYVVALRGGGNWSKRFYEALNWGRIPAFIDTDCVLPYDFAINWKRFCVWIERHEIPYAAEKIADFHASLTNDGFVELQRACRQLWVERLSSDGFYRHFSEHLDRIYR